MQTIKYNDTCPFIYEHRNPLERREMPHNDGNDLKKRGLSLIAAK